MARLYLETDPRTASYRFSCPLASCWPHLMGGKSRGDVGKEGPGHFSPPLPLLLALLLFLVWLHPSRAAPLGWWSFSTAQPSWDSGNTAFSLWSFRSRSTDVFLLWLIPRTCDSFLWLLWQSATNLMSNLFFFFGSLRLLLMSYLRNHQVIQGHKEFFLCFILRVS